MMACACRPRVCCQHGRISTAPLSCSRPLSPPWCTGAMHGSAKKPNIQLLVSAQPRHKPEYRTEHCSRCCCTMQGQRSSRGCVQGGGGGRGGRHRRRDAAGGGAACGGPGQSARLPLQARGAPRPEAIVHSDGFARECDTGSRKFCWDCNHCCIQKDASLLHDARSCAQCMLLQLRPAAGMVWWSGSCLDKLSIANVQCTR